MAKVNFHGAEPPRIFNGEALHARNASLAALKNRHTPSRGYSISVGEVITFPMWKEIEASPATYLKEIDAFVGSRNTAILIRVTRTKGDTRKDSWFDISVLSYAYLDASDKPAYPDELRSRLAEMNSDYERLQSVAGKLLVATGNRIGYKPVFKDGVVQRDEYGHRILEQTNVVTVKLMDKIENEARTRLHSTTLTSKVFCEKFYCCLHISYAYGIMHYADEDGWNSGYEGYDIVKMEIKEILGDRYFVLYYDTYCDSNGMGEHSMKVRDIIRQMYATQEVLPVILCNLRCDDEFEPILDFADNFIQVFLFSGQELKYEFDL